MNIQNNRIFYKLSNSKLRRARRLYVAICLRDIEKYGNPVINMMAERAQERGLYSDKTLIRDVRHSINGHHFQLTKYRVPYSFMQWHNWCRLMDIDALSGYFKHKKKITVY